MSIYPLAVQRPGPAGKTWGGWGDVNQKHGAILHSMQGGLVSAFGVLDDESLTDAGAYRATSWHFSIAKDGTVYQHYPIEETPFHAGNRYWNDRLIGIEHEGGPPGNLSEPFTEAQTQSSVALVKWLARECGWVPERGKTLFEHNETTATACPSGRIQWSRYMPANDPNHEDGYDTGLTRLRLEDMLRLIRDEHAHAEGDPAVLHEIIDRQR